MNVIKNFLGVLGYFIINVAPWLILLIGLFKEDLYLLISGGIFVILLKLRSIEDLLISISNVLISINAAAKKMAAEDNEKEDNKLNKNMFR